MTNYVLWQSGLSGPEITVLVGYKNLMDYESRKKLCDPIPIKQEDEGERLDVLALSYPLAEKEGAKA